MSDNIDECRRLGFLSPTTNSSLYQTPSYHGVVRCRDSSNDNNSNGTGYNMVCLSPPSPPRPRMIVDDDDDDDKNVPSAFSIPTSSTLPPSHERQGTIQMNLSIPLLDEECEEDEPSYGLSNMNGSNNHFFTRRGCLEIHEEQDDPSAKDHDGCNAPITSFSWRYVAQTKTISSSSVT